MKALFARIQICLFAALLAHPLTSSSQPVITTQPTNQIVLLGSNVTFGIVVSDSGPLAYQWRLGGTNIPGIIVGVAGRHPVADYYGDGGPASLALFIHPTGIAFDGVGNLFIADTINQRVRKIDTNGIINLVAGNGIGAYSGDGAAATNASLYEPLAMAVDSSGQVFIADWLNNRVRKVDTNGIITTVAGNGYGALTGSGAYTGDGGPATSASLWGPSGIALDVAGNLFIADGGNNVVRRVGADGKISTVVGNGAGGYTGDGGPATNASLASPSIIAFDPSGVLLIADSANSCIRKVDTNGVITTVAGNGNAGYTGDGGTATNASLNGPVGVAVDNLGNIFIADTYNFSIRKVDGSGIITTVAGHGVDDYNLDGIPATQSSLSYPNGVAVDARENIFIADTFQNRIRAVWAGQSTLSLTNVAQASAGTYDVVVTGLGGSVTSSPVTLTVVTPPGISTQPQSQSVAVGQAAMLSVTATGTAPLAYQWSFGATNLVGETNSELLIGSADFTNAGNYQVTVTNLYGTATSSVAAVNVGYSPAITTQPSNVTVLVGGNTLLSAGVTGSGLLSYQWQLNGTNLPNNVIITVAGKSSPGFSGDYGAATNATLNMPVGMTSDNAGNLFIADSNNHRIRKIDTNGIITTVAGKSGAGYTGDGMAGTNTTLYSPSGLAFDAYNNLFIADTMNNRVRRVDTTGYVTTVAGTNTAGSTGDGGLATIAKLNMDRSVAFDASGNLYIADTSNSRIRKVNTNGVIATVAGNGTASFSGDGGNATNTSLNYPYGVTIDSNGNLFIADTRNNRIRKVGTNGIITTVAGKGPSYPFSGTYSGDGGAATNAFINNPRGVTIDPVGNLFIADAGNNRIRKVDANGLISTVAGKFNAGFSGDGGAPTNASLHDPEGIAFDNTGNLFIADSSNARIRKVFLYASFNRLTLHNLNPIDAGNYSLVVTSQFGSVTGAVASVTVLVPPQQFTGRLTGGGLQIQFYGTPNYSYVLQSTTNLTLPVNWQPVLTNPADVSGNWQFTDTNLDSGQKFYRASGHL